MDAQLRATIQELKDRQEIYECLMRYCRGIDRLDSDMLASAYHPDAYDDHADLFVGPVEGFIKWVLPLYREHKVSSHHEITNHYCEIDGDVAHAESYFISSSLGRTEPSYSISRGRYVDRFEKRDGRWAIAVRICLVEFVNAGREPGGSEIGSRAHAPRDRSDPSYMRPLIIDPARLTG